MKNPSLAGNSAAPEKGDKVKHIRHIVSELAWKGSHA